MADPSAADVASAGVTVTIPLKLVPGMNVREHWHTRRRRVELEHGMVVDALRATGAAPPKLPVTIVIVRTGWCELDSDNCAASAKGVIDSACSWLRVDDRNPGVHVHLAQRTTRARRVEHYGREGRYQRTVVAATVTLTIRPWRPEDTSDRLRVLAREVNKSTTVKKRTWHAARPKLGSAPTHPLAGPLASDSALDSESRDTLENKP
jgi:hypothetical protein